MWTFFRFINKILDSNNHNDTNPNSYHLWCHIRFFAAIVLSRLTQMLSGKCFVTDLASRLSHRVTVRSANQTTKLAVIDQYVLPSSRRLLRSRWDWITRRHSRICYLFLSLKHIHTFKHYILPAHVLCSCLRSQDIRDNAWRWWFWFQYLSTRHTKSPIWLNLFWFSTSALGPPARAQIHTNDM